MYQPFTRRIITPELAYEDWLGSAWLPSAGSVRRVLTWSAVTVCGLGYLRELARLGFGIGVTGTSFINLNAEQNLCSWFGTMVLFGCSFLLLTAGRRAKAFAQPRAWFWFVLSFAFVALSLDEASSVHESVRVVIQQRWHPTGAFRYAWTIPAVVLVPLFAMTSLPFLLSLPRSTALRFIASGAVYVAGALGCEMIEGMMDGSGLAFVLLYLLEETLEVVGSLLFLSAIMDHLQNPLVDTAGTQ